MTVSARVFRTVLGRVSDLPSTFVIDVEGRNHRDERTGEISLFFDTSAKAGEFLADVFNALPESAQQKFIDKVIDTNENAIVTREPLAEWERELLYGNANIIVLPNLSV